MICKHCSTENEESAVYCKNCGERLDGKKKCPKCSAFIDGDAVFCTACGTRVDGKTVCKNCGKVYEGNFCPACGEAQEQAKPDGVNKMSQKRESDWKKIVSLVGLSVGFVGAVVAFIFMFFSGISIKIFSSSDEISASMTATGNILGAFNIFDCFGNNFDFISVLETTDNYTEVVPEACWFYAILQTIIASATIILTTTFFIISVCRFIKTLLGRKTKSAENFMFATVISFLAGAICFRSLVFMQISGISSSETARINYRLNGATVAGIIVSLIFCAIMFASKITVKGSALRGMVLYKTIFSGACAIISVLLLLILGGQFTVRENSASEIMKVTSGFVFIVAYIFAAYGTKSSSYTVQEIRKANTAFSLGLTGHIITLVLIVLLAIFAVYSAIEAIDDKHKSIAGIILASIVTLLSIVFTVISGVGLNCIKWIANQSGSSSINVVFRLNVLSFALIVFALILLAVEITCFVMQRKNIARNYAIPTIK